MEWEEVLRTARELWGDGIPSTPENLHAAAVGLVSQWYRNTEAVEYHAHANGPWSDPDMLRRNAWATELCLEALRQLVDAPAEEFESILCELLTELIDMLPNARARRSLHREKKGAPFAASDWIEANGLGNWLESLTHAFNYPRDWWGVPGYEAIVDEFETMDPEPPEPGTFRERMLSKPWQLTDEQAGFVCDHRYDVGRS